MSQPEWKRLRAVVERASELESDARAKFLEDACGGDGELRREAESLLAVETRSAALEPPESAKIERALDPEGSAPSRVGPWQLERRLGSGGMGAVWLGHRVDGGFAQRAAVKLIKRGMDTDDVLRRFERERALLASLEHPSIARLYDGGSTSDGRPYLVMEFVDGLPLDAWCARHGVTLAQKLDLFTRVCDAVEFAHQRLVVHRDLKPQNVLVTAEGTPKLLDFGIAKVLASESEGSTRTQTELRMLTPQYASPEQLRGALLTTRSDVFSLGVMLYELLAGRRPFDARRTDTTEAEAPSRTTRALAGDLDTIVMKALQLDPERRYASAAALADDLRRHLSGEPVLARPDTWAYRTSKFFRRHRAFVIATATVIAALTAGLAIAWTQYREAESARQAADARLQSVARLAATLTSKVSTRLSKIEGVVPEREALLRELVEQLQALVHEVPANRSLAIELGWAQRDLADTLGLPNSPNAGKYDEAREVVVRALGELDGWIASHGTEWDVASVAAALLNTQGALEQRAREPETACATLERALELVRAARRGAPPERESELLTRECNVLHVLVNLQRDLQRRDAERELSEQYLRLVQDAAERYPASTTFAYWLGSALFTRGTSEFESGDFPASRANLERAVQSFEALYVAEPATATYRRAVAAARYQLSHVLGLLGEDALALEAAMAAWEAHEETLRREPSEMTARDMAVNYAYNAGSVARSAGDLPRARKALERACEAVEERMGRRPDERSLFITRAAAGSELALVLSGLGEHRAALERCQRALADGLTLENDSGRGRDWNYGMAMVLSNAAACRVGAARANEFELGERRRFVEDARVELERARELMAAAEAAGQLGADERALLGDLDEIELDADAASAALPVQ
jgi:tetratricopeptide (TPR) repeat protein